MNSRLIDIFLQAASINALSQEEKPVADFIKNFLVDTSFNISEDESKKASGSNTGNIIVRKGAGGDFVLLSHMDTARPTLKMRPVFQNGKITSAGDTVLGVDNRLGIAVLLYTLEKIHEEKIPVKDFTVAFTTCEETTLMGSKSLKLGTHINRGFVFDSSFRPGNFINAACGSKGFKIRIRGRASHSGIAPEKGINAIAAAVNALYRVKQGRIDDETTLNIGKIKGGSAVNVVPEEVCLEGEVRSFNTSRVTELIEEVRNIFLQESSLLNAEVEFESDWDFKPYTVESTDIAYNEITGVLKKTGLTPEPRISLGGSDANSLNELGISAVNLGIGAQNPHSNDEFVLIEDLTKSAEIAMELVKK
jgi:tripeptide aminopeptidase